MRRLNILISAILMMFNLAMPAVKAENSAETVKETADFNEAQTLCEFILGEAPFKNTETEITRGDFVCTLAKVMKATGAEQKDYFFDDVKSFSSYADGVYAAYDMGWVSKTDKFEPQRFITMQESVKILVEALGYGITADMAGGYPFGYETVAGSLGLYDGVNRSEETVSRESAIMLIKNAISSPRMRIVHDGAAVKYEETDEDILQSIYNITEIKGIITRTAYNSLDGNEPDGLGDGIGIDGYNYDYDGSVGYDILGTKHRAFIQTEGENKKIICLTDLSERISFDLQDFDEKTDNRITYYIENKTKSVRISRDAEIIYNGRKVTGNTDGLFTSGAGSVMLADNNGDGTYDVVFLNRFSYMSAGAYDGYSETIRDRNAAEFSVSLEKCAYIVLDETQTPMDLYDIAEGDIFRVIKSADNGFVQMLRCKNVVQGMISEINADENSLRIDDTEYFMSEYFKKVFLNRVKSADKGTFYVSDNVVVSVTGESSSMMYGYLRKVGYEDYSDTVKLRIFSQSGETNVYTVRKKITLDGKSNTKSTALLPLLKNGGETVCQLIRYMQNGNGEITVIDTATTELPETPGVYKDSKNSLTKYNIPTSAIVYKQYSSSFASYCNIDNAVVFSVPSDSDDDRDFAAQGKAAFVHNQAYSIEAYDLDDTGAAGAVVYKRTDLSEVRYDRDFMLVKNVALAVNSDDEEGYSIEGWCAGQYTEVFMPKDISVSKSASSGIVVDSSHPILSGGDIIRCEYSQNGEVRAVSVEFDARKNVFSANSAYYNIDYNHSPMFFDGMIYNCTSTMASVSNERFSDGTYDFSPSKLRYVSIDTANIVSYDVPSGEIRPIAKDNIKTWLNSGTDAYYAVICQNDFVTKTIVLYDRTEERR